MSSGEHRTILRNYVSLLAVVCTRSNIGSLSPSFASGALLYFCSFSTMPSLLLVLTILFTLVIHVTSSAHASFHVQYPWMTRGPSPQTRPEIDAYNPFCRMSYSFVSSEQ
jgi:hypothetical protein